MERLSNRLQTLYDICDEKSSFFSKIPIVGSLLKEERETYETFSDFYIPRSAWGFEIEEFDNCQIFLKISIDRTTCI